MAMTWVWTGMVVLSLLFGLMNGTLDTVASAAMDGAQSAVELSISMAGILCLWSGVMEVMRVCGLSDGLARAFRPLLRRLMPQASRTAKRWPLFPPICRPIFWGWATLPRRLGSRPPAGWPGAAAGSPVTSCVCWWCSTPRPSNCCPPQWPPSVPPPAARLPSTSCRRYGSPPSCRSVPAS